MPQEGGGGAGARALSALAGYKNLQAIFILKTQNIIVPQRLAEAPLVD